MWQNYYYFFFWILDALYFSINTFLSLFLSWKKKTLCVAFLHLIYQLLNYYPAISPSDLLSFIQPLSFSHRDKMPMKTIMKIICLCVWEMWHTSWFCSFCVGVFVLCFVEVSVERGELPGERWIKCFSFSFFSMFFLLLKGSEAFP